MTSPIDEIFKEIFGHVPNKDGAAFEKLAAIAAHMISGGDVKHDDRSRGEFSKTLYQLDVHQKTPGLSVVGEAKDYTSTSNKVVEGTLKGASALYLQPLCGRTGKLRPILPIQAVIQLQILCRLRTINFLGEVT